ncbi:MAG TPA: response regulator [Candidatus Dormibacteraeota bacterium]
MARVLVAESDDRARRFLQQALELGDHEVTVVACGADAIDELGRHPFDLLITDHQLPVVSGVDVIGFAHRVEPDLCCLILAGPTDADVTIAAMEAGAMGVIPKPARVKQVLLHVLRAAERRELARLARRARLMDSILGRAGVLLSDADRDADACGSAWWAEADPAPPIPARSHEHAHHRRDADY